MAEMDDPELDLLLLIERSIIERYEGDLEKHDDPQNGGCLYTPLDTDNIRELVVSLWGELVHSEVLENAINRLTEHGAEVWPRGYCEEDIEAKNIERSKCHDYDSECCDTAIRKLRRKLERCPDSARPELMQKLAKLDEWRQELDRESDELRLYFSIPHD
jgi:hypothetical protein